MILLFVFIILFATSEATFCASPNEETLYVYTSPRNCTNFIACIDNEEYEFECLDAPIFYPAITEPLCVEACASVATTKKSSSKSSSDLPPDPLLFPDSSGRTIICPPVSLRRTKWSFCSLIIWYFFSERPNQSCCRSVLYRIYFV